MENPRVEIMGYKVYAGTLDSIKVDKSTFTINTLNAYSYVASTKDKDFEDALQQSDLLVADGFPVVLAAKYLRSIKIHKIAGADIFYHYLKELQTKKGSCFFLGSSEDTLQMIAEKLKSEFPSVRTGFFSPPFKSEFSSSDNSQMIEVVNHFCPDVLFIGMTAPKQEKWVHQNKQHLKANIICSIGAVFDFYAGKVKRPSSFWIKLKLEWFIRFIREPRRLWKRYFIYSPLFFFYMMKSKFK